MKQNTEEEYMSKRMELLHSDLQYLRIDFKEAMHKMTDILTQMVRMEEHQKQNSVNNQNIMHIIEKQDKALDELEKRVDSLESDNGLNKQARKWVFAAIGGIITTAATIICKMLGLF